MARKQATHRGECQICGRIQMLPGGMMAKHGYTVSKWYGFSGTCAGSDHLPFNIDKALIPPIMESVRERITQMHTNIAILRIMPTEPKAFFDVREGGFGEKPVRRAVTITREGEHNQLFLNWKRLPDGKEFKKHFNYSIGYEHTKTPITVAHWMNLQDARDMEMFIKSDESWLEWQAERLATWKPTDLLPLKGNK